MFISFACDSFCHLAAIDFLLIIVCPFKISGQAEVGDGASGEQIGVGDGTVTAQDRVGETLPLKDKAIGDEKDGQR